MESTLSTHDNPNAGTRLILIGLASLVLLVLVATLIARLTGYTTATPPSETIIELRELGFRDLPRGIVEIYDWQDETVITRLAAGDGSFIRGVVRSLVRQRRGLPENLSAPFVLAQHSDGRLILSDPATGETIDLVAFGPTNIASFRALLASGGATLENADAGAAAPPTEQNW